MCKEKISTSDFFNSIDWELLRDQKIDVLDVIESLICDKRQAEKDGEPGLASVIHSQVRSLDGIIALIDGIQDSAVDNFGLKEKEVFKFVNDD